MKKSLPLIILSILAFTLIGCGDSVECVVKEEPFYLCAGDEGDVSYKCPAGTAAQVENNEAVDAECDDEEDNAARAACRTAAMRDGKYEMEDAEPDEDCGAAGTVCSWETGRCED